MEKEPIISDITVRPVTIILSPMAQQCKNVSQCLSVVAISDVVSLPGGDVSQPKTTTHHSVKLPQQFGGSHVFSSVQRGRVREYSVFP